MPEEQEKTYEVKDKRRVNADGTLKEEAEETPAEQVQSETEETAETGAEQAEIPPPNIYLELQFMLLGLSQMAWQFMGIRLAPGQKELIKDMAQAKLAIDTIAFLAEKLQPQMSEEDRKGIQNMVSDLQINFVMHSKQ